MRGSVVLAVLAVLMVGCGGTRVLKEAEPFETKGPLAAAEDQHLGAVLDWVIVRGGPGTWARNADWDEYLLRVRNRSDQPLRILDIHVHDSLGTRVAAGHSRRQLVNGAKQAARRYKAHGLEVKAGMGGATLAASGAAVYSASAAVGVAALSSGSTTAAMGAVAGIVVVAPALALGGMVRGINNGKVDRRIKQRRTPFPAELAPGAEANLVVFFPVTPSPTHLSVRHDSGVLLLDTRPALTGLHLDPT